MTSDTAHEGSVPSPPAPQRQYPCASCGAALEFVPGTSSMVCPYCGSRTGITAEQSQKHDFTAYSGVPHPALASLPPFAVVCAGCGSRRTTTAISSRCPACNSALLVTDGLDGQLESPDGIVPFVVSKDRAGSEFKDWSGSRWFAPNALKKVVRTDSMVGSYLPFWGFDDRTATDYVGRRGEHYYETETYTVTVDGHQETRTRQVQHTRWYPASGRVCRDFVDLTVPAVAFPDLRTLEKLGPWTTADATGYEPQYLAGFDTPRYTVSAVDGFAEARRRMATQIEKDCLRDIGGDEQRLTSMHTTDSEVLFRLLLMPLWLATYAFGGKTYHVYVNANTGEVIGERPYSVVKIALLVLVVLVVVAAVVVGVQTSRG